MEDLRPRTQVSRPGPVPDLLAQEAKEHCEKAFLKIPGGFMRYRSKAELFGLPLFCVAVGPDLEKREARGVARGIVAIGDIAIGGIALGGAAVGFIAFGGLAGGVLALGGFSVALLAIGGVAIGGLALGGCAIGYQALGGLAIGYYSLGGLSIGVHPQGGTLIHWPFPL